MSVTTKAYNEQERLTLPSDLLKRFRQAAKEIGKPEEQLLIEVLEDFLEDYEDTVLALRQLQKDEKCIPFSEMEKELGLDRDFS